jgi:branched-chain amino acid transport system substrate-binding protein
LLRRCFPRSASLVAALALAAALTGCSRNSTVPAPVVATQPPPSRPAPPPPTPGPPPPAAAGGPVKVALLLPLSGANADLGKSMLEAAQMALFTTGGDQLTLVPRDTQGTPDGAANAARAAVGEGVKLILGPLLATEVEAVKPVARDAHIAMIAYSTATQLAGGDVFLMGFLPRQEVSREVSYARERGLSRFAALAPNTPYGHLMGDSLREVAGANGASVTRIEYFDPRLGDVGPAVQRLTGGARPAAAPGAAAPPPDPSEGFDALLLPEGGDQLKQLARQVRQAGLEPDKVRLLGSGLWDDASVSSEPALAGGWFAASPPDVRREFENRFRTTFGHAPPRLASLAFDSAALAAVLAKTGGDQPFSRDAILNPRGFTGVDGLFRFTPEGRVQRGLAVIEVQPGGNQVVSPAPSSFPDFAY